MRIQISWFSLWKTSGLLLNPKEPLRSIFKKAKMKYKTLSYAACSTKESLSL